MDEWHTILESDHTIPVKVKLSCKVAGDSVILKIESPVYNREHPMDRYLVRRKLREILDLLQ